MALDSIDRAVDGVFYHAHDLQARVLGAAFNVSRYTVGQAYAVAGIVATQAYLTASVMNSASTGDWTGTVLAAVVDVGYSLLLYTNYVKAGVARQHHQDVEASGLSEIMPYESRIQRMYNADLARWYALSEMVWPASGALGHSFEHALTAGAIFAMMFATSALFGTRYILAGPERGGDRP